MSFFDSELDLGIRILCHIFDTSKKGIMKKTIKEIKKKIKQIAEKRKLDAGYAGLMSDGGASELENELDTFILGFDSAISLYVENKDLPPEVWIKKPIDVPARWKGFFIDEDPDYEVYLKLKERFEKNK